MEQELRKIRYILQAILMLFALFVGYSMARASECPKPVQVIKQGQVANCDGFLFSDKAEVEAAEARDDVKYFNKLVPKLEQRVKLEQDRSDILEKRLTLYINQAEALARHKAKSETRVFWERLGFFVAGSLVMYGAYQVAR